VSGAHKRYAPLTAASLSQLGSARSSRANV
jgi:hypothetical protein